jgi:copper transport protein
MTKTRALLLLVVATVCAAGAFVGLADPASAHAVVIGSSPTDGQTLPAAPEDVQITFSEHVSADKNGLTVLNSSGERVDNGDAQVGTTGNVLSATLRSGLADGTYVMNYRVISADGHPVSAAIVFGIGDQTVIDTSGIKTLTASTNPAFEFAAGVARFVTYAAALLAAGLSIFVTFVHDQGPDRWRLTPVVRIAAVVAGVGAVATVAIQAALVTGNGFAAMTDTSTLRRALTEGLDWATVLLLVGLAMVHLSSDADRPVVGQSLAFYGSLGVTASFAFWGHTTTVNPAWIMFLADFTHVAAAAIWLGGLVGLAVTLRLRSSPMREAEPTALSSVPAVAAGVSRPSRLEALPEYPTTPEPPAPEHDDESVGPSASCARMVATFSTIAGASILLLVIAGVTLAWKELGGFSALSTTTYGRLVLLKVGVLLVILLAASYNRFWLLPEIEQEEREEDEEQPPQETGEDQGEPGARPMARGAWRHLRRSLVAEVAGITVVLGITAVLVNTTPPSTTASNAITDTVQTAAVAGTDASVEVALVPGKVGINSVHISYFDKLNRSTDTAQQVSVELTQPDQGIGPIQRDATKAATGHYIVDGLQVPTAGKWKLTLITRVSDFKQQRTDFTFNVSS